MKTILHARDDRASRLGRQTFTPVKGRLPSCAHSYRSSSRYTCTCLKIGLRSWVECCSHLRRSGSIPMKWILHRSEVCVARLGRGTFTRVHGTLHSGAWHSSLGCTAPFTRVQEGLHKRADVPSPACRSICGLVNSSEHDDAIPIAPSVRSFWTVTDATVPSSQLVAAQLPKLDVGVPRLPIALCKARSETDASDRVADGLLRALDLADRS